MRFEELGRHLAVASEKEAIALVQADRNFWNVVSIHAPNISRVHLRGAKRVHYVAFDDAERIEGNEQEFFRLATMEDLRSIFAFIDLRPSEPLLVHCQAGISRTCHDRSQFATSTPLRRRRVDRQGRGTAPHDPPVRPSQCLGAAARA
jgi:predicted protein tyrosine phosphatase